MAAVIISACPRKNVNALLQAMHVDRRTSILSTVEISRNGRRNGQDVIPGHPSCDSNQHKNMDHNQPEQV
jgi:hypothetical protein